MNIFTRGGGRGSMGGFTFFPPVIKFLLISNVAIFLLSSLFSEMTVGGVSVLGLLYKYFALWPIGTSPSPIAPVFLPWQLISYMFMHADLSHVLFNMLALWMFGMELEQVWGSKKFSIYYTLCGLGGGIAHLIISPLLGDTSWVPLVGASGAVFGLLIAFGLLFPDRPIYLYFFIPIRAKFFVAGYMALEFYFLYSGSNSGISHLAHLGGAVVGIVYMLVSVGTPTILANFRSGRRRDDSSGGWQNRGGWKQPDERNHGNRNDAVDAEYYDVGSRSTTATKPSISGTRIITQTDVDRILDKIASGGWDSLSEDEREIMFEASRKMDDKR
ncbi:MAG TPA: rhomboid family intramembrane serine protease [Candidatus Kapabacteria bacterium]